MDFLNKSLAQVSELFRSMTPGARVTAGLLLAVVVVSMGYLFRQGTAGPDAFLFGGAPLSDGQLTRVEAAIAQAGLSGFEREGSRIRVPAGQQAAYLAAVADAGALPPNFNTILEEALDKGGPWESAAATRERLKIGRQQTLSEIVRAMNWVEDAVVLYDEQESREPGKLSPIKRVTASVNVQPVVGETLDPRRAKMLQKLVAHAVNMQPQDVNVTNLGDGGAYGGDSGIFPDLIEDEFLQNKIAFEMQKRESILSALRDIPGVRVEVNADFNDTVEARVRNVKPDKAATTPSREVTTAESETQFIAENGGRPGVTVQGPNGQGAAPQPEQQVQSKRTNDVTETDNVVSVEQTDVVRRGYTLKEVWATVTVPRSYVENVWKDRNPQATDPPKPEDLTGIESDVIRSIENVVEPLLILQVNKGENTYKHVRVNVLDTLPAPAIEPPSTASKALAWTGRYWSTLAMLGVAMFSLLVLRSVVKNGPTGGTSAAAGGPALTLHAEPPTARNEQEESAAGDDRPRLRLKKGKSLKDDLVDIVREDPDAAADILRSWIGKAG
jgi:flagellar M-ring protein FliF